MQHADSLVALPPDFLVAALDVRVAGADSCHETFATACLRQIARWLGVHEGWSLVGSSGGVQLAPAAGVQRTWHLVGFSLLTQGVAQIIVAMPQAESRELCKKFACFVGILICCTAA